MWEVVCPDGNVRHFPYNNRSDADFTAQYATKNGCKNRYPDPTDPLRDSLPPCPQGKHLARHRSGEACLRPNALLSKPPAHVHQLRRTDVFRRVVGRSPTAADYEGVHTTSNEAIAAAYAMGTWEAAGDKDSMAYPVVLVLDVSGLEPQPDVDAMMNGADALNEVRGELREALDEGKSLDEIAALFEYWEHESNAEAGDSPAGFVFDNIPGEPVGPMLSALSERSDEEVMELLRKLVDEGAHALPGAVLSALVEQQRYLADFELDRLIRVVAFRPWWNEVLDAWWDWDEDAPEHKKAVHIEGGGWKLWTLDDVFDDIGLGDTKNVYDSGRKPADVEVEYHGTISTAVNLAFPGLVPTDPPFPVE